MLPNPTGVADPTPTARYPTPAQIELRKRFTNGWTFRRTTCRKPDGAGASQTRFDPDRQCPAQLEYARADDRFGVLNFSTIYELPLAAAAWLSTDSQFRRSFVSGWELTSIFRVSVRAPILITDNRGALNRAGRSGRPAPQTNLTLPQLKAH